VTDDERFHARDRLDEPTVGGGIRWWRLVPAAGAVEGDVAEISERIQASQLDVRDVFREDSVIAGQDDHRA
jgi:hypothetical protein